MDSGHKRLWQGAFLLGIAASGGAAILAYGLSTLAAVISGSTLILGIVNGLYVLLNRSESGNENTATLSAKLAGTLNVNKFLKFATAVIWITALGLGIFGVKQTYAEYVKRSLEAKKITIEGLVLSAGGDPADNAVVTLFMSKRQEMVTAPGGKFTFPKVDLTNEPSKTVRIRASWRSREAEITAHFTNGPPDGLTIKLPPGDPPFRVTYFVLEENAIDFLLNGKMNATWEEKLGGQPFIVPNEVSATLSSLLGAFSEEIGYSYFEIQNSGKKKSYEVSRPEASNEKFFVGSGGGLYVSDPAELIHSLEDVKQPWHALYSRNAKSTAVESLVFRKFIDRSDLDLCADSPFRKFYQHITRDFMPTDFGYVDIYLEQDPGCGDASNIKYVLTKFVGRSLRLRVAVVENVSKDSISLDNFSVRVNRQEKLRTRAEDKVILDSLAIEKQDLFVKKLLSPGEKIVIPLELPLSHQKDQSSDLNAIPLKQNMRSGLANELKRIDEIKFPVYDKDSPYIVNARAVENILNRPGQDFTLGTEYLYGPSVTIEGLEIDKVSYPFRQFDSAKIIIRGGTQEGSCPYVYTYSTEDHSWLNEGVILYGINGKHKETTEEKELTRFDGRVLIKEKDPENSFIDSVYVKAINLDGSEMTLHPKDKTLRFADHNYLRLRQGEAITIEFDLPRNSQATKYILGMVGYYIPYKKTSPSPATSFAGNRSAPFARKMPRLSAYQ